MTKHLIFYWYVKPDGWCGIYDLHISNLLFYINRFDKITFVLSSDDTTDKNLIDLTKNKLMSLCKDVEIIEYANDKNERESKYFYNEIILKLDSFNTDEAIFFAHNKGVQSIYTTKENLYNWINVMYFGNLFYIDTINTLLLNKNTVSIGTATLIDYQTPEFYFSKYKWIYTGTFFWLFPSKLKKYVETNKIEILPSTGRYYTEAFFSTIFPDGSDKCLVMFGNKKENENFKQYIDRVFTEQNKIDFQKTTATFNLNDNLDIFVFAHKNFETERKNPVYKIVCNKNDNVSSDSLDVIKLDCELSNIGFSEGQKIYELYRQKQVKLSDYVGLAHYHRFLSFGEDVNFIPDIDELFEKYDVLTKQPINVYNLRQQYDYCHNVKDFDLCIEILKEFHPEYEKKIDKIIKKGLLFESNIIILKKKDFISLCDFVFPILFEYCKRVGIDKTSDESFLNYKNTHIDDYRKKHKVDDINFDEQARICAFLFERLLNLFLFANFNNIGTLPMVEK